MTSFVKKYRNYRHRCLYVNRLMEIFFSLDAKISIFLKSENGFQQFKTISME